jgi:hypothetical protein
MADLHNRHGEIVVEDLVENPAVTLADPAE